VTTLAGRARYGTATARARRANQPSAWGTVAILGFAAYLCATLWAGVATDLGVGWGALAGPALLLLIAPLLTWVGRRESRFDLTELLFAAFALKLLGSLARWVVVKEVYDDVADAGVYHFWGERLAPQFRSFDFSAEVAAPVPGTGCLRYITGLVYAVAGTDMFVGFLVFSTLSFVGCLFFYLAFVTAVPNGNHRRYALLIFLFPTLLFWPSSIGKDAWMVFTVGIAAYGAARLLAHERGGLLFLAGGLVGATLVRPHITLIFFVAIFVAYLVRPTDGTFTGGWIGKVAGVLALLVVGSLVVANVEEYFGVEELNPTGVTDVLDTTERRSSQGGSSYEPVRVNTPIDYPWAVATVLFRPFPYEARSSVMIATSAESLALLALTVGAVFSVWRPSRIAGLLRDSPYVVFAASYVAMFCFAFAAIGNFGILARQRAQVLPLLFVLLCVQAVRADEPEAVPAALAHSSGHTGRDDATG
jgi:hypothetical protein